MNDEEHRYLALESLIQDVVANQNSLHATLTEIYEKLTKLEASIQTNAKHKNIEDDEFAFEETVDRLYEEVVKMSDRGTHLSVSYLMNTLDTSEAVAHELLERIKIDNALPEATVTTDTQAEAGSYDVDVFTTIDLKSADKEISSELYQKAKALVIETQKSSIAHLTKGLGIDKEEAKAIQAELERQAVITPPDKRNMRKVLIS